MPKLTPTSPMSSDLTSDFNSDWAQAQTRYTNAINGGYDPQDAQKVFLEPVKAKWSIIQSSPNLLYSKSRLADFQKDYDASANEFAKNYASYNRDGGVAAFSRTLQPTIQKWQLESQLPVMPKHTTNEIGDDIDAFGKGGLTGGEIYKKYGDDPAAMKQFEPYIQQATKFDFRQKNKLTPSPVDKVNFEIAETKYKKASGLDQTDQQNRITRSQAALDLQQARRRLTPTLPSAPIPQPVQQPEAQPAPVIAPQPTGVIGTQQNNSFDPNARPGLAPTPVAAAPDAIVDEHPTWTDAQKALGKSGFLRGATTNAPKVTSQAEYDKIEAGGNYLDAQGNLRVKSSQ